MSYLLDTNTVIGILRGKKPELLARAATVPRLSLRTCSVVKAVIKIACAIPLKGTLQVGYGSLGAGRRDVRCVRRSTSRRRMGVQMPSGRTKGLTKTLCISVRAASGLPVGTCRHASDRHKPGTPTSTSLRAAPTRLISTRIAFLAASGQVRSRCISSRAASGLPQTQCRAVVPVLAQVPDALPG